jgi:hypothetical protein
MRLRCPGDSETLIDALTQGFLTPDNAAFRRAGHHRVRRRHAALMWAHYTEGRGIGIHDHWLPP